MQDIDIKSEEVQEILGTPPGWLTRWGTAVAVGFFAVLVWTAYWIRYPDTVNAPITVTSTEPPRKIYAEANRYISDVLVRNEQEVDSGQVLLAFRNNDNSSVEDIMALEDAMSNVRALSDSALRAFEPPRNLLLGEVQTELYDFLQKQSAYRQTRGGRSFSSSNARELNKRIESLEVEIEAKNKDKVSLQDQLDGLSEHLSRQEELYKSNRITFQRLQETQEDIRSLDRERQGVESDIKSARFEIIMLQNQIKGERASSRDDNSKAFETLRQSFIKLQNKTEAWKKRNLIVASIKGIVSFDNDVVSRNQFARGDVPLLGIVPTETTETIGRMSLSVNGSGKVVPNQQVMVKFDSYPFYEYGAVIGIVKWKGRVPNNEKIPVEIIFPNGLVTTRNRTIEPSQEMSGQAEIITSDKRLIQKIFENFRRMTST